MFEQEYKKSAIWQKAMELALETYRLTRFLPEYENHTLADQMCRAAVDIPAKIAEGHEVPFSDDCAECLSLAHGSQCELETLLYICVRLGYFSDFEARIAFGLCREISEALVSTMEELEDEEE